uniref:Uncharacterized protein n=1 Tax=Anguilla anguilla TaxID=7936 RepID=A0A0E9V571_ANGAN
MRPIVFLVFSTLIMVITLNNSEFPLFPLGLAQTRAEVI